MKKILVVLLLGLALVGCNSKKEKVFEKPKQEPVLVDKEKENAKENKNVENNIESDKEKENIKEKEPIKETKKKESEPKSKPEKIPVPKPESKPKPKPQPQPENKPKPKPQPVITYKEEVSYENISFKEEIKYDNSLDKGKRVTDRAGVLGQDKIITTIKLSNGREASRSHKRVRVKNPVNKIIRIGTKVNQPTSVAVTNSAEITKMFNGINKDRNDKGLNSLTISSELSRGASVRAPELIKKFSHTRPDGSEWWTVSEIAFGENVAYGSSDGSITHGRFMASQGHKDNILNTRWKTVGIASIKEGNGPTYWAVLFGK